MVKAGVKPVAVTVKSRFFLAGVSAVPRGISAMAPVTLLMNIKIGS